MDVHKLTKIVNRYVRTDGRTDPSYRKATLLNIVERNPRIFCKFSRIEIMFMILNLFSALLNLYLDW